MLFQAEEKVQSDDKTDEENVQSKSMNETPAQDKLIEEINNLNKQISSLSDLQNSGFSMVSHKDVKELISKRKSKERKLKELRQNAEIQKNIRKRKKEKIQELCETNDDAKKILKSMNREKPGKPRIGNAIE